jgi:hypothetical protein
MKKLITGAIVAAALAVPATPAFAIHDPFGPPAGVCANSVSAIGLPGGGPNPGSPNLGVSNTVLPGTAGAHAQGKFHCLVHRK